MDTKRLILSITLTLSLVIGYRLLIEHLYKLHPNWRPQETTATTPVAPATTQTLANSAIPATNPSTNPVASATTPTVTSAATPGGLTVVGSTQPVAATIGLDKTIYPMILDIDPKGAGLKSVVLSDYYESADQKQIYKFQEPLSGFESVTRPLATRIVTVNGTDIDVSSEIWHQAAATKSSVTYTATITQAGKPVIELSKQFTLLFRDEKEGSGGFDVSVKQSFRNLSGAPVKVSAAINGPSVPRRENDMSEDRRYVAGYDDGDKHIETGSEMVTDLKKDKPAKDFVASDARPMLWVGACSSYFESIIRPDYSGKTTTPPIKITAAVASAIDPGTIATGTEVNTSLTLYTSDFTLSPGMEAPLDLHVFFGPKKRALLSDTAYYSNFPLWYHTTMVYTSGPCGYITFSWLISLLSGILTFFHMITRDWGLAIIGLVCLVRLLLHPITKKAQINMVHMSKMGPEIERLKKKYGDNKDELNKAMMTVYKEQGMTPVLGCLPMFLQTPIWIALWSALQSTFELRQAGFLRFGFLHLTWISDLSKPDSLIAFSQPLSIFGFFHLSSLNILPLLLAVMFFIQQSLQPAPANMTPEQEQQRKMMKWMSLLFPVMLYGRPSGLSLYILTSTTIGIIENKIIRDHIKQREEAEKTGQIIVDASPIKSTKVRIGGKPPEAPKGKIAGMLANLQAKAEEIRREAEKRAKDRT